MNASKTHQCLSCRIKSSVTHSANNVRRSFSTTPVEQARKRTTRSRYPNVKAEDLGIASSRQPEVDALAAHLRPYTAREKKLLAMKYTPEQMAAIEAGEKSIDATDLMTQGRFRTDPMRIDYIDDFATVRPIVDKAPQGLDAEMNAPLALGAQPVTDATSSQHGEKSARPGRRQKEEEKTEEDQHLLRLCQQTGLTPQEIRRIRVKNLVTHRVVNQTRMGKIQSLYFLTIAGNEQGMLGIGEGKAAEEEDGRRQAMMNAIRNMKPIPRYEERTIFGEVEAKVGASVVKLSSRPPGTIGATSMHKFIQDTNRDCRFWKPMSASNLRIGPRSRYPRSRSSDPSIKKQDERCQGCFRGINQPASAGRCCAGKRQKTCGCARSVLRRSCKIETNAVVRTECNSIETHMARLFISNTSMSLETIDKLP
jgi:small subunit ribosomal protein S5